MQPEITLINKSEIVAAYIMCQIDNSFNALDISSISLNISKNSNKDVTMEDADTVSATSEFDEEEFRMEMIDADAEFAAPKFNKNYINVMNVSSKKRDSSYIDEDFGSNKENAKVKRSKVSDRSGDNKTENIDGDMWYIERQDEAISVVGERLPKIRIVRSKTQANGSAIGTMSFACNGTNIDQ